MGKNRIRKSIPALLEALQDQEDRTELGGYPLRRNAARALGKLGESASNSSRNGSRKDSRNDGLVSETGSNSSQPNSESSINEQVFNEQVITALIEALNCEDFYVREAAAQSIEEIAASSLAAWQSAQMAIAPLIKLLEAGIEIEVGNALTNLSQPYEAILEVLGRLKANAAKSTVESFLGHTVPRIRFAAARAMYGICEDSSLKSKYADLLIAGLSNPDINLRRTVLTDLGEIGYLPAAKAIAQCQAENSFKLFALKRILDLNLVPDSNSINQELRQVMEFMDQLL